MIFNFGLVDSGTDYFTPQWIYRWLCLSLLQDYTDSDARQELHLADTLVDLLTVLVEFWYHQHFKLNQSLVEKSLKDLAEHFAVISQGMYE